MAPGSRSRLLFLRNSSSSSPSTDSASDSTISSQNITIYESAIEELRKTFSAINKGVSASDLQVIDISISVFNASDEYLALLRDKDNVALVILSYFCVLLKNLDGNWWIAGRARHILASNHRLVDAECRLLMWWPMEELGWLPPSEGSSKQT